MGYLMVAGISSDLDMCDSILLNIFKIFEIIISII